MSEVTTVNSTETYTVRLESKPDGGFKTSGSARVLYQLDEDCQPGLARQVIDASTTDTDDEPDTLHDFGADFEVGIEADVEGSNTETGTENCQEDFVQPFEGTIRTDFLSTPEFAGNQVVALVWDGEAETVVTDPFGNPFVGTLRVTGRLERIN